ncbi:immunoglobulin domain-containing protein, partial [Flavobacterium sp. JAS]|uniref:immunoglobulin domain-containing protein n=1 Tax=Flavobacterium sp. JAS TaxID=2897329 RepID=UPI001E604478
MENNILLTFFGVLSNKIRDSFLPKNRVFRLRFLKLEDYGILESFKELGKIKVKALAFFATFFLLYNSLGFVKVFNRNFYLLFFSILSLTASGQITTADPAPLTRACWGTNCVSGDFTLNKIYLASDLAGTPLTTASCSSPGSLVNVYLAVSITNTTSSSRSGIYLTGTISSSSGITTNFAYCFDIPVDSHVTTIAVDPTPFSWTCGDALMLTNAFTGWNSASGTTCTVDCSGATTSKCKTYPDFIIITPLVTNFTSQASCPGGTAFGTISFASTTTGGNNSYSYVWEYSTDGSSWTQFSTEINPQFSPGNNNPYYIRLTVTDSSSPQNSDSEIKSGITAGVCCVAPTITSQPSNQTKCVGENASFSVSYTGGNPAPTIQWQVSTNGGANWGDLATETNATLTLNGVTVSMSGNLYRAVLTSGSCTPVNSDSATLTVGNFPTALILTGHDFCSSSANSGSITSSTSVN